MASETISLLSILRYIFTDNGQDKDASKWNINYSKKHSLTMSVVWCSKPQKPCQSLVKILKNRVLDALTVR